MANKPLLIMENSIIKLKPCFKDYVWGGNKLKDFGKESSNIIAESWELSTHSDGLSFIDDEKNTTLIEYIKNNLSVVNSDNIPIIIKFIDANRDLSIQVHPNDEYAFKYEKQLGKTEVWYILESGKESYIYYGLNRSISKEELHKRIENGTILEVLNKVYTKPGDCFLIEPGTIHSIGSGNVICEIQESSNVTYRVFDYNRKDGSGNLRQLHIDKALDVINFEKLDLNDNKLHQGNCKYFNSELFVVRNRMTFNTNINYEIVCIIDGCCRIENKNYQKGDTLLIPYEYGEYSIEGNCQLIRTLPNI